MDENKKSDNLTEEVLSLEDAVEDIEASDSPVGAVVQTEEEEVLVADRNARVFSDEEEEVVPGAEKAKQEKDEYTKKKLYFTIYDFVSVVMSSFIIIAIIFTFVFRLVGVDGESMTNTLQHGDWLLTINKTEYVQGDIVVVTQDTYFHEPLIKRVIAVGGQTVDIDYETATVYVDGVALDEPYVKENFLVEKGDYRQFPYTVPEGHLFCMGDNRNGSTDSRSTLVGAVDQREILGKAVVRIIPFGDFNIYDYE